ncbi:MAG TPA: MFS transporter [Chitinophagales bacterium]|nr:MFS transporter [Chitinophagales bacterium]
MANKSSSSGTFAAVVSIFFFWGFMAASNGIFIPFCKKHFGLSQFQSQLIDSTFYGGYFIGSILLFGYTYLFKKDFVLEYGYPKSFAIGLVISALGAACMIPSLHIGSYGLILSSFFIIALGFSLQQIAANPFVVLLGEQRTGAHRLSLAGGVNSVGTTIGPLIVAYFLFGSITGSSAGSVELKSVDILYVGLIVLFLALAVVAYRIKMDKQDSSQTFSFDALKYPQLRLGMLAIFAYVGVEVTIQSNMGALLATPEYGSVAEAYLFPFISLYWGSLMVGRWTGSAEAISENKNFKKLLMVLLPFLAFALVYVVNFIKANAIPQINLNTLFIPYMGFVLFMVAVAFFTIENSAVMLLAFSLSAMACMVGGLLTSGNLSVLFFMSGGLWCSVLWPCIFSNAIKNLGSYTSQASAFLIMMILGGAVIPPFQGWLADKTDIKTSYIVAPLCFAYLAFYGWKMMGIKAEGESTKITGH